MKAAVLQALVLVGLGLGAGVLSYRFHPEAPALYLHLETEVRDGEVTMTEVRTLETTGGVLWVDARVRSEFLKAHVPGAILLNEQEWEQLMFEAVEVISGVARLVGS